MQKNACQRCRVNTKQNVQGKGEDVHAHGVRRVEVDA